MLENWKLESIAYGRLESVVLPFVSYGRKQRQTVQD